MTEQLSRIHRRRAILYLLSPDLRFLPPTAKMFRTAPRMAGYVKIGPCACVLALSPRCGRATEISLRDPEGIRTGQLPLTPGGQSSGLPN